MTDPADPTGLWDKEIAFQQSDLPFPVPEDLQNPPLRKCFWVTMDARGWSEPEIRELVARAVQRRIPEGAWDIEWEIRATWYEARQPEEET